MKTKTALKMRTKLTSRMCSTSRMRLERRSSPQSKISRETRIWSFFSSSMDTVRMPLRMISLSLGESQLPCSEWRSRTHSSVSPTLCSTQDTTIWEQWRTRWMRVCSSSSWLFWQRSPMTAWCNRKVLREKTCSMFWVRIHHNVSGSISKESSKLWSKEESIAMTAMILVARLSTTLSSATQTAWLIFFFKLDQRLISLTMKATALFLCSSAREETPE